MQCSSLYLIAVMVFMIGCVGGCKRTVTTEQTGSSVERRDEERPVSESRAPATLPQAQAEPLQEESDAATVDTAGVRSDPEAPAGETVGIPECDTYLARYEACVARKVPMPQRAGLMQTVAQMRSAWKAAATIKTGKETLASTCKIMLETAKKTMAKFGCEW